MIFSNPSWLLTLNRGEEKKNLATFGDPELILQIHRFSDRRSEAVPPTASCPKKRPPTLQVALLTELDLS